MYETGKCTFGKSFEIYLKMHDQGKGNGSSSARYLMNEYEFQKSFSFYESLLQQMKQQVSVLLL